METAAAEFNQNPSEMQVPLATPQMRTVTEELAACQLLFHKRDSRKQIEPIYECKALREQKELQNIQERRRQRQHLEKKIKVRRSPSLPPMPTSYLSIKNSPRSANFYRK